MALHVFVFLLVVCLLLSLALLWRLCWFHRRPSSSRGGAKRSRLQRLLKPRCPDDCPACRLASTPSSGGGPAPAPVRPWREVKSRRGAPKRVNTEGFACPNPQCPYSGITDAHVHALVGDGKHGRVERIQTFRCQACHTTFTSRHNTPFYRLKTSSHQVAVVLSALAEGLDPSAAERVFGFRQATITTWLTRAGEHAQTLHERFFCHLKLPHLQLDELRTRLRSYKQVLWLWLAIDPCTKILPVLHLGPRTQNMAHLLIHSLQRILAPGCLPLFTSDGLNLYFYALTAHFGRWLEVDHREQKTRRWQVAAGLIYGQVKKSYRRRKLVRVTHVMRLGTQADLKIALQGMGFSGRLNTAFIERVNLTVRHGVAALARRTWSTAQQAPHLLAHLQWWRAYYHFVRPHASLRVTLGQPRERGGKLVAQRDLQRTPAMAAGRASRQWSTREVLCYPLPPVPCFTI
jgi:transposase-like protein/IS1 family transposase